MVGAISKIKPTENTEIITVALKRFLGRHENFKRLIVAGDPPKRHPKVHISPVPRLTFLVKGRALWKVAQEGRIQPFDLSIAHAVFMPPLSWVRTKSKDGAKTMSIVFNDSYIRFVFSIPASASTKGEPKVYYHHTSKSPNKALWHGIQALVHLSKTPDAQLHSGTLMPMILKLSLKELEASPQEKSRPQMTLDAILQYIHDNHHLPISRSSVAKDFGIHSNTISNLFKQNGSDNFISYLTRIRMEKARQLLQRPENQVGQIAEACGFQSMSYFIKVFKRQYHQSPAAYRLQMMRTEP